MLTIEEIKRRVRPICKSYGIKRLYLFGSYARGESRVDSDIDFRLDKGKVRGVQIGGVYMDLQEALQRKIDLLTTNQFSSDFLENIQNEEVLVYDEKQG